MLEQVKMLNMGIRVLSVREKRQQALAKAVIDVGVH